MFSRGPSVMNFWIYALTSSKSVFGLQERSKPKSRRPHNLVFPPPYRYTSRSYDNSLGSGGDIYKYLAELAEATSVPEHVKSSPFGQTPIDKNHEQWEYYNSVIQELNSNNRQ
ncbi:hypothetical protein OROGR_028119 [Orobanche gracilis]